MAKGNRGQRRAAFDAQYRSLTNSANKIDENEFNIVLDGYAAAVGVLGNVEEEVCALRIAIEEKDADAAESKKEYRDLKKDLRKLQRALEETGE